MFAPFSKFYIKISVSFYLNVGKYTFGGSILKPTAIASLFLKNGTRNFQNSPPFDRSTSFYAAMTGNFKHFQCFNFESNFLKNENFYQKTGVHFSVESTKTENAIFRQITALPEENVKQIE